MARTFDFWQLLEVTPHGQIFLLFESSQPQDVWQRLDAEQNARLARCLIVRCAPAWRTLSSAPSSHWRFP